MATVIRLKRGGRTHSPAYRVVVMDSRTRARGRELDSIGFYHPCERPAAVIEIDAAKAVKWLSKGAQTSDTVHDLFTQKGIFEQLAASQKASDAVVAEPAAPEAIEQSDPTDQTE